MEEIRLLIQKENSVSQTARLTYLSETLADALQDMEKKKILKITPRKQHNG